MPFFFLNAHPHIIDWKGWELSIRRMICLFWFVNNEIIYFPKHLKWWNNSKCLQECIFQSVSCISFHNVVSCSKTQYHSIAVNFIRVTECMYVKLTSLNDYVENLKYVISGSDLNDYFNFFIVIFITTWFKINIKFLDIYDI